MLNNRKLYHGCMHVLLAALVSVSLLTISSAHATTYTYSSPGYTNFPVGTDFMAGNTMTMSFTTAAPLPMFGFLTDIGPGGLNLITSLSADDDASSGALAYDLGNITGTSFFNVITDAIGNITAWDIFLIRSDNSGAVNIKDSGTLEVAFHNGPPFSQAETLTGLVSWSFSVTPAASPNLAYVGLLALLVAFSMRNQSKLFKL